jgi:hypothetical protein
MLKLIGKHPELLGICLLFCASFVGAATRGFSAIQMACLGVFGTGVLLIVSGVRRASRNVPISIEGPLENKGGLLFLRIPRDLGGDELAKLARGISSLRGDFLELEIKPWLAEKLNIAEGSLVVVDNLSGKFTITRSAKNDENPPDVLL